MRWIARQSFLEREERLVLTDSQWDRKIRIGLGVALQAFFPAEICSRDQIELCRVRIKAKAGLSPKSCLPIQQLLSFCGPPRRGTTPAVLEPVVSHQPDRGVSIHWMWELQQCIVCHEVGCEVSQVQATGHGSSGGSISGAGNFPKNPERCMTKGNQQQRGIR
jgi:hypothetical protein